MKSQWDTPGIATTINNYWNSLNEATLRTQIVKWVGPQKGLFLDAGCGSARFYDLLQVDQYVGVDGSEEMLKLARQKSNIVVVKANLESLPFGDRSFNGILCAQVFRHMADYKPALKELCRVAAEKLFITDMFCFGKTRFGKERIGKQEFENNMWSIEELFESIREFLPGCNVIGRKPFNNNTVGVKVER